MEKFYPDGDGNGSAVGKRSGEGGFPGESALTRPDDWPKVNECGLKRAESCFTQLNVAERNKKMCVCRASIKTAPAEGQQKTVPTCDFLVSTVLLLRKRHQLAKIRFKKVPHSI